MRYWLALLRHEEALAVRPRARRVPAGAPTVPELATPSPGQDYIKLAFEGSAAFLVGRTGVVEQALDSEACAFFEDWLNARYRRGAEDGRLAHLVTFPTLLLPRQELAGLLRFAVSLQWQSAEGKLWVPPTPAERARNQFPEPPRALRCSKAGKLSEDALPFFVDSRLLHEVLHIDSERLESFFDTLKENSSTPEVVVRALSTLLTDQLIADGTPRTDLAADADGAPPETHLATLHQRTAQRLSQIASRARVFDVAVLLDASRNRATFHVQRDLQAALTLAEENELLAADPLSIYLGARKHGGGREAMLGRFRRAGLTESQRQAAELFLGSRFTSVQGPPGTGKTHLIASLAADELVHHMAPVARDKHPTTQMLLVTSTNNRAVDNVIDPLSRELDADELPLALRVGSREVIEKVTAVELTRAKRWLERRAAPDQASLAAVRQRYSDVRAEVEALLEPWTRARLGAQRLQQAREDLTALERAMAEQSAERQLEVELSALQVTLSPAVKARPQPLCPLLGALARRLGELSHLAEAEQSAAPLRLEQHFKLTQGKQLAAAEEALGFPLKLALPTVLPATASVEVIREAWESAAEQAVEVVVRLQLALEEFARHQERVAELEGLRSELGELERREQAALSASPPSEPERERLEPILHALFEAAIELREHWALTNKAALVAALSKAIEAARRSRSLRALLSSPRGPGAWLRRLYPVWGCTLLSIGNNFGPEREQIERVVIDEAGQCHSAYAVSAILRAQSVLVIGDVNQLEPVVEISKQDELRVLRGARLSLTPEQLGPYRMYEGSRTSAQSLADCVVKERPTMIDHFRCQAEIAAISEELCRYGLRTHTEPSSARQFAAELVAPVLHTQVIGEQKRFAGSWFNHEEVLCVLSWVERLLRAGLSPAELGIITPFRGQLEHLWRALRARRFPVERSLSLEEQEQGSLFGGSHAGISVGTVHRFQGGEKRVVLFTTTVTNERSLPFINQTVNLVNVAASRAKEHLITIGCSRTLRLGARTRLLVERAQVVEPDKGA
jgi:hypothetical protein